MKNSALVVCHRWLPRITYDTTFIITILAIWVEICTFQTLTEQFIKA